MGLAQQSFGELFETLFSRMCRRVPGMAITRFPAGCKVLAGNRLVRIKTPWDWIVTYEGRTALIDTKTTEGDSFPYSKIEKHQVEELAEHEKAGGRAGYVLWYRKSDSIVFVSSVLLCSLLNKRGGLKVTEDLCVHLGKSSNFNPKMIFGIQ